MSVIDRLPILNRNRKLDEWMKASGAMVIRAFSHSSAAEMPSGWSEPEEFDLNAIIAFYHDGFVLFMDEPPPFLSPIETHKMNDGVFSTFIDEINPTNIIGYGARKWDLPLIKSGTGVSLEDGFTDILDTITNASSSYFDTHGSRYTLSDLAKWNGMKLSVRTQTYLKTPFRLLADWKRGAEHQTISSLMVEMFIIALLAERMHKRQDIRLFDTRTGFKALVPVDMELKKRADVSHQESEE